MYEDHSVEERYLHNFSPEEKKKFRRAQRIAWREDFRYRQKLEGLLSEDSPAVFANYAPTPSTALEIKYVLNRIAANDPMDKVFEVCAIDEIPNADKLGLSVAMAFQNNTMCETVILNGIGLTDRGLLPVLHVLSHKKLRLLDISGNSMTDRSLKKLDTILANPNTKWRRVHLGQVNLTSEQQEAFSKYPNLKFENLEPHTAKPTPDSPKNWIKQICSRKGR